MELRDSSPNELYRKLCTYYTIGPEIPPPSFITFPYVNFKFENPSHARINKIDLTEKEFYALCHFEKNDADERDLNRMKTSEHHFDRQRALILETSLIPMGFLVPDPRESVDVYTLSNVARTGEYVANIEEEAHRFAI